jgi:hypothetical protein
VLHCLPQLAAVCQASVPTRNMTPPAVGDYGASSLIERTDKWLKGSSEGALLLLCAGRLFPTWSSLQEAKEGSWQIPSIVSFLPPSC